MKSAATTKHLRDTLRNAMGNLSRRARLTSEGIAIYNEAALALESWATDDVLRARHVAIIEHMQGTK